MLPRTSRLRSQQDIMAVIRQGRRHSLRGIDIYILPRPRPGVSRAACVVGVRVSSSSVVRHRYQRWLRVLARETLATRLAGHPGDMVWVAQPSIQEYASLATLRLAVSKVLQRTN